MDNKRASDGDDGGSLPKKPKTGRMTFAQRMMEKMGHVEGQGLGKGGEGMLNPIAVKLRPQGVGVGSVKEKTPQQKAEERRVAEQNGEKYEDSSEEERQERRRRKEAIRSRTGQKSGLKSAKAPTRTKVRTVAQIELEEGLKVPDIFKSFIDYTGSAPKQITSSLELSTSGQALVQTQQSQAEKLIKNARLELEAFASTWHELQDRKAYCEMQEADLQRQLDEFSVREKEFQDVDRIAEQMSAVKLGGNDLAVQMSILMDRVEQLQSLDKGNYLRTEVSEVVAASIDPFLVQSFDGWSPLSDSPTILTHLEEIKSALIPQDLEVPKGINGHVGETAYETSSRSLDAYESTMFIRWLPKMRTAVINDWDPREAQPMIRLLNDWKDVLPPFLLDIVINQLTAAKLIEAFKAWKPNLSKRSRSPATSPHEWLFPWLEHLNAYHLDPRSAEGLLAEVKRKFRSILGSWNLNNGIVPELDHWIEVDQLRIELQRELQLKMLPRLSQFLLDELIIDPSNQDRTPIDVVMQWQQYFSITKFARIIVESFFPKWFNILYVWLTSDPNYEEVGQWYEWWHGVFPKDLSAEPTIDSLWNRGLEMMSQAMELGPEHVKAELVEPTLSVPSGRQTPNKQPDATALHDTDQTPDEPATMRDMLEELCEEGGLFVLPLRKAHPETGHPLLRITANAAGAGGVVIYIAGDVVMAQNKRDRSMWEPLDVFAEGLLSRLAEMR